MTASNGCLAVERLTEESLQEMLDLQDAVVPEVPAGHLRPKAEPELRAFLRGERGAAFGIRASAGLLAMALLRVPHGDRPNGKPRFRLVPDTEWSAGAAFLENALVRPRARGRGLQRALIDARLAHAFSIGVRWVCGGVRLGNRVSWSNLLESGLVIADMRSDLGEPMLGLLAALDTAALPRVPADVRRIDWQDALGHRHALDEGYVGVRLGADRSVLYQRLRERCEGAA